MNTELKAIAHYVQSIALMIFASVWSSAAVAVGILAADVTEFAFAAGGIGAFVLVLLSLSAYFDGGRAMRPTTTIPPLETGRKPPPADQGLGDYA